MSTPTTEQTTFPVPGWERPAWAVEARFTERYIDFIREASVIPLVPSGPEGEPTPATVSLVRNDVLSIDAERGTMSIEQGKTVIHLDIEELSVTEARKLAAALVELADHADGRA